MTPGTRLGPYKIIAPLGAGGMGEVYRARDTKLNRDVAIKVLPELLASDPERLARFEREAQALAALNHPHIAQIYGVEESRSVALVMELVEGPTLADRIASSAPGRGLPVEEVIRIASQVADALEAAHAAGIVHRDLKPANIKVRPDGVVKVLDFGLARMAASDPLGSASAANSPTYASPAATAHGVILGTAAYMAPEQARGQVADARSDLWAFGVVLYEMLTGAPLFQGKTVSDVLASVLRDAPTLEALPAETPANVRRLLRRCLKKDPQLRLRSAGDARLELIDDESGVAMPGRRPSRLSPTAAALIGLAVAAVVLGTFLAGRRSSWPPDSLVEKWIIPQQFAAGGINIAHRYPAISPDGRRVAYLDGGRLLMRDLDAFDARVIVLPNIGEAGVPAWSPDSTMLAYGHLRVDRASLWRVAAAGGEPAKICDLPSGILSGLAWLPDGKLVASMSTARGVGQLFAVSASGGAPQPMHAVDTREVGGPATLPDGGLLYSRRTGDVVEVVFEGGGKPTTAIPLVTFGVRYSPTGHLVYGPPGRDNLWAIPFDLSRRTITGEPFRITTELAEAGSVSADGTLTYQRITQGRSELKLVNRDGTPVGTIGQPQEAIWSPAVSWSGARVAVVGMEDWKPGIWVHDIRLGTKSRVTSSRSNEFMVEDSPAWFARDDGLAFMHDWQLYAADAGGGGSRPVMPAAPANDRKSALSRYDPSWSRDGKYLVFGQYDLTTRGDVWFLERGAAAPRPFLQSSFMEAGARLSPDNRYIAYVSDETGRSELYLRRFPGGLGKVQLSSNGAMFPSWSPRGDEIFFVQGHTLMAVTVQTTPGFHVDPPHGLFELEDQASKVRTYDTIDGQRFVVAHTVRPPEAGIAVVKHWYEEFRRK